DGAVELARAHAQAVAVERGVRAAVDHAAGLRRAADLDPVAVAPDRAHFGRAVAAAGQAAVAGGEGVEIARQVALAAVVAPQIERHGRNRLRADQLAHGVQHGPAFGVPGLHRRAEHAALQAAGDLRQFAVAAEEGAGEVGAAGDVGPPDAV